MIVPETTVIVYHNYKTVWFYRDEFATMTAEQVLQQIHRVPDSPHIQRWKNS